MLLAKRSLLIVAMAMVMALVLAACGSDEDPTAAPTTAPQATATTAPQPTATSAPGADPTAAPTATPSGRDMEAYFSGETIRIIVGFSPGGGYDTYARLVAAHLGDYIPGNPRTLVQNLPGGGGLRGLQEAMRAEPDGFTMVTMANRWPAREVAGEDVEDFDAFTAKMIGTPAWENDWQALCIRSELGSSWEDVLALGRPITTGTSSPGGDMIGPQLAEALGLPVKVIFGYEGTSEVLAAIDRGELDATTRCPADFWLNLYPQWEAEQKLKPVFYWRNEIPQSELDRYGATTPVPHLFEVSNANEEEQAALLLAQELEAMTRMYTLPPGTPDDIVAVLTEAFKATLEDQSFLDRALLLERTVNYGDPQILINALESGANLSDESRALFANLYGIE